MVTSPLAAVTFHFQHLSPAPYAKIRFASLIFKGLFQPEPFCDSAFPLHHSAVLHFSTKSDTPVSAGVYSSKPVSGSQVTLERQPHMLLAKITVCKVS